MKVLAFARALYDRAAAGELEVIERFEAAEPKTKRMHGILGRIAPRGRLLVVDEAWTENVILAIRNLERVCMCEAHCLNALDLCHHDKIIVSEKGLSHLLARARRRETS